MRGEAHLLAAVPLAAGVVLATSSPAQALGAAAASVLMDLDHLPDYLWWRGGWHGVRDFLESFNQHRVGKITIILHSWELPAALAPLLHALDWPAWAWPLLAGWLYHLLWDLFTNPTEARFYSFIYRARQGFSRLNLEQCEALRRP